MPVPMSGEPVRIYFYGVGATASTIGLFIPATNNPRTLLPYEQLVICSLMNYANGAPALSETHVTSLSTGASGNPVGSTGQGYLTFGGGGPETWHDDGTGAMTFPSGVTPTVYNTSGSAFWLSGTGLIVEGAPSTDTARNPQWAQLTQHAAGLS